MLYQHQICCIFYQKNPIIQIEKKEWVTRKEQEKHFIIYQDMNTSTTLKHKHNQNTY